MKHISTIILVALAMTITLDANAQKRKKDKSKVQETSTVILKTRLDSISYIIGQDIGANLIQNEIQVNEDLFIEGIRKGLAGNDSLISEQELNRLMMSFQQEMMAKREQKSNADAAVAKAEGLAFLQKNKQEPGVVETASGLQYKVIQEGTGENPTSEDVVEVHYTGKLLDGTVFDSSVERGQPIRFPLNGVIRGWTEGLQLMKPGAKYILYIPSDLAYGDRSTGPIPAGSTLIFEVELLSIDKGPQK